MTKRALEGYRLIDFGWAVAGAVPGYMLADMGAQVIRIESRGRMDGLRLGRVADEVPDPEEYQPMFHCLNRGKLGVTLNLKSPEAADLIKKLAKRSDGVIENFTPGVMKEIGIDYDSLKAIKPDIIMVSMACAGQYGPLKDILAYAPIMSSLAGIEALCGYADDPEGPCLAPHIYADYNAGVHAALAMLAALRHRNVTGQGQHIDISEWEAATCLIGEAIMGYTMNGDLLRPRGNQRPGMAPHSIYPCQGEDQWVAISVETDDEWSRLRSAMNDPAWAKQERFSDGFLRAKNEEELDLLLGEWTSNLAPHEVTATLQEAGVAAAPVMSPRDLYDDPHFKERRTYDDVLHPRMGKETMYTTPWKFSDTPAEILRPCPLVGEHNDYVFSEVLGLSPEEVARLKEVQAIY